MSVYLLVLRVEIPDDTHKVPEIAYQGSLIFSLSHSGVWYTSLSVKLILL